MKTIVTHSLLAIVGLASAWWAWTKEDAEETPAEAVEIFECKESSFVSATLSSETQNVRLHAKGEGDGRVLWVQVDDTPKKNDGAPEQAQAAKSSTFVAGKDAQEYIAMLSPMMALRSLGQVEPELLEDLGLQDSKETLEFNCGKAAVKYTVGATAFGSPARYISPFQGTEKPSAPKASQTVYLVAGDIINQLKSAKHRLMQRDILGFDVTEVEKLKVEAQGASRTLLQRDRRDPARAQWVDASDPDRRNELFGNWVSPLHQMRVQEYLNPDQEPGENLVDSTGELIPVVQLTYLDGDGDTLGTVEMVRVGDEYYARSPATHAWVSIPNSLAKKVDEDVPTVLGIEVPAQPEESPEPATTE